MDMNDKMRKAFIKLNQNIEADIDKTYQKLYDKYVNLELSHNRKKRALNDILYLIRYYGSDLDFLKDAITKKCNNALFSDCREKVRIKK